MATINGRKIKLLKEAGQPIGIASGWKKESDWMRVTTADGVNYMVHYTDPIEVVREPAEPIRRRIVMEEGCATCAELARGSFGPPHDPSPRCESGKRPHCTCDICF